MQFSQSLRMMALAAIGTAMSSPALAADHLDAPVLQMPGQGTRDINDIYAFQSPTNADNTVLIFTVNPLAGILSPEAFGTDVSYDFLIDNDGDAQTDITFSTTFVDTANGGQSLTLTKNGQTIASGASKSNLSITGGGTLTANVFDDPFFFDLNGFNNNFSFTGDDFFAGANVSALVFELPSDQLTSSGSTAIGVSARTTVNGIQVDRIGRPAINTALIVDTTGQPSRKDAFNAGEPVDDLADFGAEVEARILALSGDAGLAATLTPILLPDVLTFDTASSDGFLNGRRLEDDVIDAELDLLTGGGVVTDFVSTNDVPFLNAFPFLAPAHVIVPEPAGLVLLTIASVSVGTMRLRRKA